MRCDDDSKEVGDNNPDDYIFKFEEGPKYRKELIRYGEFEIVSKHSTSVYQINKDYFLKMSTVLKLEDITSRSIEDVNYIYGYWKENWSYLSLLPTEDYKNEVYINILDNNEIELFTLINLNNLSEEEWHWIYRRDIDVSAELY